MVVESGRVTGSFVPAPNPLVIGKIVHYIEWDGAAVPAIVTRVKTTLAGVVDLQVFHFNRGCELATSVVQGDGTEPYTWCWPPRA